MIIEDTTTQSPVAWVYQEEDRPKFLVINYLGIYAVISTFGVSLSPRELIKDPYHKNVIKRYYKGDKISFTVEEGDWL